MGDYCNNSKDILYKYFLKTIKKTTTQQKNRQNWVFNKISRYPINLLKSAHSSPGKYKNHTTTIQTHQNATAKKSDRIKCQ